MARLTIVLDNIGHKELKDYLLTVSGIKDVDVINNNMLEINIEYDDKITNPIVIKTEIYIFLDITKSACMYSFDKYEKNTTNYHAEKTSVCCEYCFMNFIEDLFDMDGIIKASSNFTDFYMKYENQKLIIDVEYDKNKVKEEDIEKIIKDL